VQGGRVENCRELAPRAQCPIEYMNRRLTYLAVTTCFVLFTTGLFVLQRQLLAEVFPHQEPTFAWDDTEWRRYERQDLIELFGIDPQRGQAGVLRQFGLPVKAHYFPPEPSPFYADSIHPPAKPPLVEACLYTYPTFEIRFFNHNFGTLEIFARDTRFPIGVAVGDSEQRVLDVLGPPPFHHASGDWTARYRFGARTLEIEIRNGHVLRLSW
jgi:hypothetical protein